MMKLLIALALALAPLCAHADHIFEATRSWWTRPRATPRGSRLVTVASCCRGARDARRGQDATASRAAELLSHDASTAAHDGASPRARASRLEESFAGVGVRAQVSNRQPQGDIGGRPGYSGADAGQELDTERIHVQRVVAGILADVCAPKSET